METSRPILIKFIYIATIVWLLLSIGYTVFTIGSFVVKTTMLSQEMTTAFLRTDISSDITVKKKASIDTPHFMGDGSLQIQTNNTSIHLVSAVQHTILGVFGIILSSLLLQTIRSIQSNTPFSEQLIRNTKIAGWVILVYQLIDAGSRYLTPMVIDRSEFKYLYFYNSLDIEFILLGILLIILSELFTYSSTLEKDQKLTV